VGIFRIAAHRRLKSPPCLLQLAKTDEAQSDKLQRLSARTRRTVAPAKRPLHFGKSGPRSAKLKKRARPLQRPLKEFI
jgi:hypothetical protein